ncbi:MAG: lipoprotein [Alphaproteobacteria bacterium]|jgi:predicted small lipoprotein YifL|nr:lipoprotein [Alphaproteobacteria bacterium]MDP6589005.1 lipoprotein [Alphaproteobacteria bacterium]|tara:strand:- start:526 stop:666 length:141 start_codon:yes stop_codon:yes gene_type:complete
MIRKLSLLMTILAALGLVVALVGCGKKGALEAPPQESALESPQRTV